MRASVRIRRRSRTSDQKEGILRQIPLATKGAEKSAGGCRLGAGNIRGKRSSKLTQGKGADQVNIGDSRGKRKAGQEARFEARRHGGEESRPIVLDIEGLVANGAIWIVDAREIEAV